MLSNHIPKDSAFLSFSPSSRREERKGKKRESSPTWSLKITDTFHSLCPSEVAPSPVKMPSETWPQLNGDSDRYCQLCHAWFNNPGMARQHYDGKKHKKNAARADLLEQLGKTLDMGEMKGNAGISHVPPGSPVSFHRTKTCPSGLDWLHKTVVELVCAWCAAMVWCSIQCVFPPRCLSVPKIWI